MHVSATVRWLKLEGVPLIRELYETGLLYCHPYLRIVDRHLLFRSLLVFINENLLSLVSSI
jgi:hypothetical protein